MVSGVCNIFSHSVGARAAAEATRAERHTWSQMVRLSGDPPANPLVLSSVSPPRRQVALEGARHDEFPFSWRPARRSVSFSVSFGFAVSVSVLGVPICHTVTLAVLRDIGVWFQFIPYSAVAAALAPPPSCLCGTWSRRVTQTASNFGTDSFVNQPTPHILSIRLPCRRQHVPQSSRPVFLPAFHLRRHRRPGRHGSRPGPGVSGCRADVCRSEATSCRREANIRAMLCAENGRVCLGRCVHIRCAAAMTRPTRSLMLRHLVSTPGRSRAYRELNKP